MGVVVERKKAARPFQTLAFDVIKLRKWIVLHILSLF